MIVTKAKFPWTIFLSFTAIVTAVLLLLTVTTSIFKETVRIITITNPKGAILYDTNPETKIWTPDDGYVKAETLSNRVLMTIPYGSTAEFKYNVNSNVNDEVLSISYELKRGYVYANDVSIENIKKVQWGALGCLLIFLITPFLIGLLRTMNNTPPSKTDKVPWFLVGVTLNKLHDSQRKAKSGDQEAAKQVKVLEETIKNLKNQK